MTMKTIRNIIMAGVAAVGMSSCSDFLDLSPHNTLDPETTMTDDVAKALTLGCSRQTCITSAFGHSTSWPETAK